MWEHPLNQMEVRGSRSKPEKSQAHAFELIGQFVCLCVLSVNWCVCVCVCVCVCPYLVFVSHGVNFVGQSDLRVWVRHRVLYTVACLTHLRFCTVRLWTKTLIPVESNESQLGLDLGRLHNWRIPAYCGTSFNSCARSRSRESRRPHRLQCSIYRYTICKSISVANKKKRYTICLNY